MTDILNIRVVGADELIKAFQEIPEGAKPYALNAFVGYVMGNKSASRGLAHYPPYRPKRYVRTYRLMYSWYATPAQGTRAYIATQVPYAIYPMGNPPTRFMRSIGWTSALERVLSNMTGGIRAAQQAVVRWVKGKIG